MTIEEMSRIKHLKGYSYRMLSEETGIEAGTIQKILTGRTKNPRYETYCALNSFFTAQPDVPQSDVAKSGATQTGVVREGQAAYGKRQGSYTLADYFLTGEDMRVELIDGNFFVMETPTATHQELISGAADALKYYIRKNGGKCRVFLSPLSVHIDANDNKTMLVPDLFILCHPEQLKKKDGVYRYVEGAPDLVMEVLSPSTRKNDMTIKLHKYEAAGVKEYWVVDPKAECVIVYEFQKEITPTLYPFTEPVPVGIYDGAAEVNFAEIIKELQEWTEG